MSGPPCLKLSYPYGRGNVIVPGEPMQVFLRVENIPKTPYGMPTPDEQATWQSSDESIFTIESESYHRRLVGRKPGTADLIVAWEGHTLTQPIHVVDLADVTGFEMRVEYGTPNRLREFTVVTVHPPGYRRDVTASPEVLWSSSAPGVIDFDPSAPGRIRLHANGGAVVQAQFRQWTGTFRLHHRDGEVTTMRSLSADGMQTLILGIVTPLDVGLLRSASAITSHEGVAVEAEPADAVLLMKIEDAWHVQAQRAVPVTIRVQYESLHAEAVFPVREESVTLGPIHINGGYQCGSARCLFEGEEFDISCHATSASGRLLTPRSTLQWNSTNPGVARLERHPLGCLQLITVSSGTTVIEARCLDQVRTQEIQVSEQPEIQWF